VGSPEGSREGNDDDLGKVKISPAFDHLLVSAFEFIVML
jgi:hypothetical protein